MIGLLAGWQLRTKLDYRCFFCKAKVGHHSYIALMLNDVTKYKSNTYLCEELIWFFGQYNTTILIKRNCVSIQYDNSEIDKHTKINHSICQKDLISEISLWSYCITFVFVKNDGRADHITFCNDEWCMICLLKQEKTLCSPSTQ